MCKLIRKTKRKSFTGYKAVRKVDEKYYSFWTGMEYEPGGVKGVRVPKEYALDTATFILDEYDSCYVGNYFGKTGVFIDISDARDEVERVNRWHKEDVEMCVLKVRLGGDIWEVEYHRAVMVGTHIDSMEEVG